MSHTPGPWAVREAEGDELYEVYREAGGELITYAAATAKQRVNANLIAAAPELLSAARLANQELIDLGQGSSGSPALAALWAAIAKAEGRE